MTSKALKNINTLLFDLDGTLIDSFLVHLEVFKITFAHFGKQFTEEDFLSNYSPNWYKTYEAIGLKKEDWGKADSIWLKEVEKKTARLFPGVVKTLRLLDRSYTLGFVTSGSKIRVDRDLSANGIKDFFETIITGDDIKTPKPSPEGIELALKNLDKRPDEATYIGDSSDDREMAKAAGVNFISVKSEFERLNPVKPDYQISSITNLPELLSTK